MAARAISSGNISFGLVSIPIKIYSATQSKAVHFSLLSAENKSRLKQQYVSASTGEIVPREAMVRGYEFSKGQFVVMSDEELKNLEKKTDRSISIEEFVPIATVDPIYFEKSNLLGPDKGGNKPYKLLQAAMIEAGRVAVGRFSTRGREQLVLVRPSGKGLVLHSLYYADEVRSFDDVDLDDDVQFREGEIELAHQLIDRLSTDRFVPEKYEDDYRRTLLEAIEKKAAGEEIVAASAEEKHEQIIDLVAALKQSLLQKRGAAGAEPAEAESKRFRKGARAKGEHAPAKRKTAT